jgi:hypothetical protein
MKFPTRDRLDTTERRFESFYTSVVVWGVSSSCAISIKARGRPQIRMSAFDPNRTFKSRLCDRSQRCLNPIS